MLLLFIFIFINTFILLEYKLVIVSCGGINMQFELIGYFLVAILGLYILVKVFSWPLKILFNLIANGLFGVLLLLLVNFMGAHFNFHIGINAITALIAGFFGIPGVIFLIIFKLFL